MQIRESNGDGEVVAISVGDDPAEDGLRSRQRTRFGLKPARELFEELRG